VRRLQTPTTSKELRFWIQEIITAQQSLLIHETAIQEHINQFAEKWLQE